MQTLEQHSQDADLLTGLYIKLKVEYGKDYDIVIIHDQIVINRKDQ